METANLLLKQVKKLPKKEKDQLCLSIFEQMDDSIIKNTTIYELLQKKDKKEYELEDAKFFVYNQPEEEEVFAIYLKENKMFIGMIGFSRIDMVNKNAELGYWLGKDFRGKGYMKEAAVKTMEYGFIDLNLHKINLSAISFNEVSKNLAIKLGFKDCGRPRQNIFRDGKFYDYEAFDLLREEWFA